MLGVVPPILPLFPVLILTMITSAVQNQRKTADIIGSSSLKTQVSRLG